MIILMWIVGIIAIKILLIAIIVKYTDKSYSHLELVKINNKYYVRVWFIKTHNQKLFCKYVRRLGENYDYVNFEDASWATMDNRIGIEKFYNAILISINHEQAKLAIGHVPDEEIVLTSKKQTLADDIGQIIQLELDGKAEEAKLLTEQVIKKSS